MPAGHGLTPTLWRTCRVLANRTRLRLLGELLKRPDQTVSTIAVRVRVPLPVASRYLREIAARGLALATRRGPWVSYRPEADRSVEGAVALLAAVARTFATHSAPVEEVYRRVTAFTQPRRLAILLALGEDGETAAGLRAKTRLCSQVLSRHLRKLADRGFVVRTGDCYRRAQPGGPLARVLLDLACRE